MHQQIMETNKKTEILQEARNLLTALNFYFLIPKKKFN